MSTSGNEGHESSNRNIEFAANSHTPRVQNCNMGQTKERSMKGDEQFNEENHIDNEAVGKPAEDNIEQMKTDDITEPINTITSGAAPLESNCMAVQKEDASSLKIKGNSSKRARSPSVHQYPSVHISYKFLSRESKMKLEELLCQWSEWHGQQSLSVESDEVLESGEETYIPALVVGSDQSCSVAFVMDGPIKKKQKKGLTSFNNDFIPLYDRECTLALTLADGSTNTQRGSEMLNATRCFNCSSYGHSLKECPKPRDQVAINSARREFSARKNQTIGPRVLTRYYQDSPRGKYDGLKPGVLAAETRKLLGLQELDPPPWLNRMREMGYPPGYLDLDHDDQPSGITIYADEEDKVQNAGNIPFIDSKPERKMTVDFPGINAPIPENADRTCWAAIQRPQNTAFLDSKEFTTNGHSCHQRWPLDIETSWDRGYGYDYSSRSHSVSHSDFGGYWHEFNPFGHSDERSEFGGYGPEFHLFAYRDSCSRDFYNRSPAPPAFNPFKSSNSCNYSSFYPNYRSEYQSASYMLPRSNEWR